MFCLCLLLGVLRCHVLTFCVSSCIWCEGVLKLHWFTCGCPAFPIPLVEECIFPLYILTSSCQRLMDSRYMGLFLGSLFCSLDPCLFYASTTLFWSLWPHSYAWSLGEPRFLLCFLCLAILGLLWFHTHFRIICSCFMKNVIGNLAWITLNL